MLANTPQNLTQILNAIGTGEERSADAILPLVYDELRAIAVTHLRHERSGHTLQATALVHETYVRLVDQRRIHWTGRAHFLAIAATMMRRILVNHAKARQCDKRGGGAARMELTIDTPQLPEKSLDLLALDEAMCRLAEFDPQQCKIVELRFFGGLTASETAQVVGASERTVHREWTFAKAWLRSTSGTLLTGHCKIDTGFAFDESSTSLDSAESAALSLNVVYTFTTAASVVLTCDETSVNADIKVYDAKITAIEVTSLSNVGG